MVPERAAAFCAWLRASVGDDALSEGVLDVAGGTGELSLELTLAGFRATLVDPRKNSGCLHKFQRKRLRRSGKPHFAIRRELFGIGTKEGDALDAALLSDANVVVGLHPDEATEAIVDAALRHRRAFAVVPCCVFGKLFPNRRMPGGGGL